MTSKFKAILGYIARSCLEEKKKKRKGGGRERREEKGELRNE